MPIALRYAARSDRGLGPKSRNEDSGYAGPHLLVLADGMGGHAAGDVASSMIVGELAPLDDDSVTAEQAIPLLERGLRRANGLLTRAMTENADLSGMGSTTIAMLRTGNKIAMAHIGDSRAFLLRAGSFAQITKDHSFVQQLVDEGRISKDEATSHPQRSVVTRVMTGQPEDEPDTSLREARVGDRFLLCSDGLTDFVGSDAIEEILRKARSPEEAADRCIEVALKGHTRDNVTVIVADVVDAAGGDLPSTVPQVVGAAATRGLRDPTRAIPTSPAAKAAALSRAATGRLDDDDRVELAEETSGRPRWLRLLVGAVLALLLLTAAGYAAYGWSQQQYFLAARDGRVALFRGVSQDLGPITLSHLESTTDVALDELPADMQAAVDGTIPASNLGDALAKVERLRTEAERCRAQAATGIPCGSTPATPATPATPVTPTAVPTAPATSSAVPRPPLARTATPPPLAVVP